MAKVTLTNVCKTYPDVNGKEVRAVHDVNLDIRDREFVVIVGPSGCGKSTTLRMVAGLEEISGGEIRIGDRLVNDVAPKDRDIAMVFQNYALYPHMTVYKNLAFGLKLRGCPRDEIHRRVMAAADILGLGDYLERKPKALSGGQRQRVAVGRAIVRQPSVFLFDEPLSNLDAKMRVQMRAEITRLHRRLQATMIYVTHDQVEAMTMGERIVVMKDGVVQQVAPPAEIYDDPANLFVAGFIGTPPMNFLHGTLTEENGRPVFRENGGPVTAEIDGHRAAGFSTGREAILGVRPEHCLWIEGEVPSDKRTFVAKVEAVELMGAETFLTLHTGAHSLTCRAHRRAATVDIGGDLRFSLEEEIFLFDPESGKRIL